MHGNRFFSYFLFDTLWWIKMQDNFKRLLCGLVAMVIQTKDIKCNFKLFWTQIVRVCSNFSYTEFFIVFYEHFHKLDMVTKQHFKNTIFSSYLNKNSFKWKDQKCWKWYSVFMVMFLRFDLHANVFYYLKIDHIVNSIFCIS